MGPMASLGFESLLSLGLPRLAADRVNLGSGVNWGEGLTPRRFLTQWHFIHGA